MEAAKEALEKAHALLREHFSAHLIVATLRPEDAEHATYIHQHYWEMSGGEVNGLGLAEFAKNRIWAQIGKCPPE